MNIREKLNQAVNKEFVKGILAIFSSHVILMALTSLGKFGYENLTIHLDRFIILEYQTCQLMFLISLLYLLRRFPDILNVVLASPFGRDVYRPFIDEYRIHLYIKFTLSLVLALYLQNNILGNHQWSPEFSFLVESITAITTAIYLYKLMKYAFFVSTRFSVRKDIDTWKINSRGMDVSK